MKQAQKVNRLMIADKSLLFCRGLQTVLGAEKDLQVVGTAATGDETLVKAGLLKPDVLVADVQLLGSGDPQFTVALRQAMAGRAILALTENDNEDLLERAIAAGASGYMLKNSTPAQLANGIRHVALFDGSNPLQISRIIPDLTALAAQNKAETQAVVLTTRECEVIRFLAEGRTARETAAELALSIKTVEAHKLNLMRKLDIHNRADLVAYALQHGLVPASVAY